MLHTLEIKPPAQLRVTELRHGGEVLLVCSYPYLAEPLDALSECELAAVLLAADGRSNQDIAGIRRVSARTVANQLASAYRKLGGASRAQLKALAGVQGARR